MISLDNYYQKVIVSKISDNSLGERMRKLLDEVITRLPEEEQFKMRGQIIFNTRKQAVEFWKRFVSTYGFGPDMEMLSKDGSCTYKLGVERLQDSVFFITIIVDSLDEKSDDYVKGLIAHELSEWSYVWKTMQKEMPKLKRLKPRARQVRVNQLTKQDAPIESPEHEEHERNVNDEAKRLGFSKEIFALDGH